MSYTQLDNEQNENSNEKGLWNYIDEYKNEHPILFWVIIISCVVILIGVILAIIFTVKKNKKKGGETNETFTASNDINDEFDYVNSVIYSTLGDMSGLEKINKNAVLA